MRSETCATRWLGCGKQRWAATYSVVAGNNRTRQLAAHGGRALYGAGEGDARSDFSMAKSKAGSQSSRRWRPRNSGFGSLFEPIHRSARGREPLHIEPWLPSGVMAIVALGGVAPRTVWSTAITAEQCRRQRLPTGRPAHRGANGPQISVPRRRHLKQWCRAKIRRG